MRSGVARTSTWRSGSLKFVVNSSHSALSWDIAPRNSCTCGGGLSMMFVQSETLWTKPSRRRATRWQKRSS